MLYTVALYGPVFNTIVTVMMGYILMKIIEDCIKIIGINKNTIKEQNSSIEILNSKIKGINEKISNIEMKIHDNWIFILEEVNDIYPAIKAVNTEIMLIKNKISI
jgi:hypothetical protein